MDISKHPRPLQILMHTDGTVTELLKLLAEEDVRVEKISENLNKDQTELDRKIYLVGVKSGKQWVYAHSTVYLKNLPESFVSNLVERTLPIGTLWNQFKMETFKELVNQFEEHDDCQLKTHVLARTYKVFNQGKLIMTITEKFPIKEFSSLK